MTLSIIPNLITIFRIVLIPPFIWLFWQGHYDYALVIFLIAGLSDGIDGLLARRFKWQSRFGSIGDPLADKLLLFATMLLLAIKGYISWHLFWVATIRDLIIVGGATWYHFKVGSYEMQPSLISKLNTFLLLLLVLLVLINLVWLTIPAMVLSSLEWLVITTCVISGLHYLWLGRVTYLKQKHS